MKNIWNNNNKMSLIMFVSLGIFVFSESYMSRGVEIILGAFVGLLSLRVMYLAFFDKG